MTVHTQKVLYQAYLNKNKNDIWMHAYLTYNFFSILRFQDLDSCEAVKFYHDLVMQCVYVNSFVASFIPLDITDFSQTKNFYFLLTKYSRFPKLQRGLRPIKYHGFYLSCIQKWNTEHIEYYNDEVLPPKPVNRLQTLIITYPYSFF